MIALESMPDYAEFDVPGTSERALPVLAIFGPNASGKSNFALSLGSMVTAVKYSHQRWKPEDGFHRHPFSLDEQSRELPTTYAVDFLVDGIRYEYGFAADDERVIEEWLYSYPKRQKRILFERDGSRDVKFGDTLRGQKKLIADVTRPNSLYLSAGAANNHPQLAPIYNWFRKLRVALSTNALGRLEETVRMTRQEDERNLILSMLRFADLGVSGIVVDDRTEDESEDGEDENDRQERPQRRKFRRRDVRLIHSVGGHEESLPLYTESSGTQAWMEILGPIVSTLRGGMVLVMDEMDASLHPLLSARIVSFFQDPKINTRGAQLVFNSHDVTLLSPGSAAKLRPDEVWFTEKDETGATQIMPLTEWADSDSIEDLEKTYIVGRLGSVPFLDQNLVEKVLGA
ncbi:ATP-binding protein [Streptomyces sp. BK022]|uniref:AAA family ATPase n=1 Tax=Streptomyces sp. BK022 TaxID=2512123 RepID=UPI0013EF1CCF|nr:ATP-binding protein [Streptomyces sp. BK022]